MKEELLHFIWQSKLLSGITLHTTTGEPLSIIKTGLYNKDAGPDFMNARIKIGTTEWAGNLEIHTTSSEWLAHKHQDDRAYDNVILHVVYHHDKTISDQSGNPIPTLELKHYVSPALLSKYDYLHKQQNTIACEKIFKLPQTYQIEWWLQRLLVERIEHKSAFFEDLLNRTNQNWEQSFYILTARYFGMKTNAQPFEWLAERLPLLILAKHKNNFNQINALVLGTAGLLDEEDYSLKDEFSFLKTKYHLTPLDKHVWKFSQTRPSNFPTVRLKQFAAFIHHSSHLFSKAMGARSLKELENLYRFTISGKPVLSKSAIALLLINSVLPALFLYGKKHHKPELTDLCLSFYESIKPEQNQITRFWAKLGIKSLSASHSQALIQLKNNYCTELNCLNCTFGQNILLNA